MGRNPRTNCTTCAHKTDLMDPCWHLIGGGGPGVSAMEGAAMAKAVRQWRAHHGLKTGRRYVEPDPSSSGCPGWRDAEGPPGPGGGSRPMRHATRRRFRAFHLRPR